MIIIIRNFYVPQLDYDPSYCFTLCRSFIYPFLIRGGKPTPILICLMALTFCLGNGYLQGRYLTKFGHYSSSWFYDPRFISGVTMFAIGMVINIHSDHILRNLRKPGETGYKIPKGKQLIPGCK